MKKLMTICLCLCTLTVTAQNPPAADSSTVATKQPKLLSDTTTIASKADTTTTNRKTRTKKVKSDTLAVAKPTLDSAHTQEEIGTLDVAWKPVVINHSIGVRGGWGMGFMRREPNRDGATTPFQLWNGGVTYRFDIPAQKYVGTISFDLDYMQKGYAYLRTFNGTTAYAHQFDVIQLSIIWQPYLPLSRKNDSRIYLIAGPFVSYTISGGEEQEFDVETKKIFFKRKYAMDPMNDYYLNYGITAGLGFQIAFGRFAISADARYNIQLSDIMRGPEYIVGNPFRTPVDHVGVSLGFHYNFIKSK